MNLNFKKWNKVALSLLCSLVSLGLYTYLSFHFYTLKYDLAFKDSICNINEIFDCTAAHLSAYSSFLGIPLSIWGFCLHSLLLFLLTTVYFRLSESRDFLLRLSFYLSSITFLGSLTMAFISIFLIKKYCIFCILLYCISTFQWLMLQKANEFSKIKIRSYLSEFLNFAQKWQGILTILIVPTSAFIMHKSILQSKNNGLKTNVKTFVSDWKSSPSISLEKTPPSLIKGPKRSEAEMVISEFADFLCVHCKNAFLKLKAFAKAYPKVRFEFYNYPLDGTCNKAVNSSSGLSCRLAQAVHCANQWDKGWKLHDEIFLHQDKIRRKNLSELDEFLKEKSNQLHLPWEKLLHCIDLKDTKNAILLQAEQGNKANVKGTPAIFINGKRLSLGYWLPNLELIRKISIKKK